MLDEKHGNQTLNCYNKALSNVGKVQNYIDWVAGWFKEDKRITYQWCCQRWFCAGEKLLLLLLLLSRFSRVRLCAPPESAADQAPLSLGFSRQEHWSGLPFPSPRHESEKWKWSRSAVSDSSRPHGLQPTRFLHPWDFPGKSTGVGSQRS